MAHRKAGIAMKATNKAALRAKKAVLSMEEEFGFNQDLAKVGDVIKTRVAYQTAGLKATFVVAFFSVF